MPGRRMLFPVFSDRDDMVVGGGFSAAIFSVF